MLNHLLTALPPSPVWNAGHHLGLPEDILKNLPHNKEGIVVASVGDKTRSRDRPSSQLVTRLELNFNDPDLLSRIRKK